jgi:predicted Zn-ribbon and HTH transcriptional regulator
MASEKERVNISLDPEIAKQLRRMALEKYGNSRSLSNLIEDMAKGLDNKIEMDNKLAEEEKIDIEEIKAEREKYATELNNDMDRVFFHLGNHKSACGSGAFQNFRCKTCGAEFETVVTDARSCPSCRSDVVQIPKGDTLNMLVVRFADDAWGSGAQERCGKKVLNYILDELKARHDALPLSDVEEKFETTPKILKTILSPLGIKAQKEKKGGRRYLSQDARSQIEIILAITEPWDSLHFSDYVSSLADIKERWNNGMHDAEKIAEELDLYKESVDACLKDMIKSGVIKE